MTIYFLTFQQYGMVDRIDFDEVDNSAIVTYKTRQDAENVGYT